MENKFKITFEDEKGKQVVEIDDDANINEVLNYITSMLIGLTFTVSTVIHGYEKEAERLREEAKFI